MHASKSFSMRGWLTAFAAMALAGCAESAEESPPVFQPTVDSPTCQCSAGAVAACDCPGGGQGTTTCKADCQGYEACTGCPDAATDGQAGSAGQGGGGGQGGAGGSAGAAGGAAGAAGSSSQCPTPGDQCPGEQIKLTGTGDAPRVGSVSSTTDKLCSDFVGSCVAGSAGPDAVYWVQPDTDGILTAKATSTTFDTALYMRLTCDNPGTELLCDDQIQPDADEIVTPVYSGKTYYFIVDSNSSSSGTFSLDISIKPPSCGDGTTSTGEECDDGNKLPNDGCDPTCKLEPKPTNDTCPGTVIPLTGTGDAPRVGSATGGTSSATDDYEGDCVYSSGKDVVFSFQSDVAGVAKIDLGGSTDTQYNSVLYARTKCENSITTELDCDNTYGDGADTLSFNVEANKPYYVFVDGSGENGTFKINVKVIPPYCGNGIKEAAEACDDGNKNTGDGCAPDCTMEPPPANDKCPGTVVTLTGTGDNPRVGSAQGGNYSAIDDYSAQSYCGSSGGKDVVYSFTPDVSGLAEIDLGGSSVTPFGTVLYARTTCATATTELDCDDNYTEGADKISFAAIAGTTYYVVVDGDGSTETGAFTLNIKVSPPKCGNSIVEPPEDCDDGNTSNTDSCDTQCKFVPTGPGDTCPGTVMNLTQNGNVWEAKVTGTTATGFAHQYKGTCGGTSTSPDVVYQLNSGPGGKVTVTLTDTTTAFDAVLYVRSGDCSAGAQIDCDDAAGDGGDTITFDAAANTSYWIFVDGWNGEKGNYELTVSAAPPVCGNGVLEGSEACDDGNTANSDGCDSNCAWEGQCGGMAEVEPNNDAATAQVIPQACGTFLIQPAALPTGDADYFKINLSGGTEFTAWTYVGKPGQCATGVDTMLGIWKDGATIPSATNGSCTTVGTGSLVCNDQDSSNGSCSKIGPYVVKNSDAGTFVIKAWNYSGSGSAASYGLMVTVK